MAYEHQVDDFLAGILYASVHEGDVGALGGDLDLPALEEGLVQGQRVGHVLLVRELHVGEALGVARVLVADDGHAVHHPAVLEVLLQLLRLGGVVHLRGEDRGQG